MHLDLTQGRMVVGSSRAVTAAAISDKNDAGH